MGGAAISFNINIMDHWFAPQLVSPNTSENQLSMHMAQVDPHAGLLAQARPAALFPLGQSELSTQQMAWRRVGKDEIFIHNYGPGLRSGYCITTEGIMAGHEECNCVRAHTLEKVDWYLAHDDIISINPSLGDYPIHFSRTKELVDLFTSQKPWSGQVAMISYPGPRSGEHHAPYSPGFFVSYGWLATLRHMDGFLRFAEPIDTESIYTSDTE